MINMRHWTPTNKHPCTAVHSMPHCVCVRSSERGIQEN